MWGEKALQGISPAFASKSRLGVSHSKFRELPTTPSH